MMSFEETYKIMNEISAKYFNRDMKDVILIMTSLNHKIIQQIKYNEDKEKVSKLLKSAIDKSLELST